MTSNKIVFKKLWVFPRIGIHKLLRNTITKYEDYEKVTATTCLF